jgi:hypothetical protein
VVDDVSGELPVLVVGELLRDELVERPFELVDPIEEALLVSTTLLGNLLYHRLDLALGLLLLGGTVCVRISKDGSRNEGGGHEEADCGRVDSDGDGQITINDAIRTLNFLFLGGTKPYCVAEGSRLPIGLSDEQQEILSYVDLSDVDGVPTIRFTGVNVQIVNGTGATVGSPNGSGNLVVGYQERRADGNNRAGSHNVVVGTENNYTGAGGLVVGANNLIAGDFSTVCGGRDNAASGGHNVVVGGTGNVLEGGSGNTVVGGRANEYTVPGETSNMVFVGGGENGYAATEGWTDEVWLGGLQAVTNDGWAHDPGRTLHR